METSTGKQVPLIATHIDVNMHDLLSSVTMKQTYQNIEHQNIEAVYTFPLPLDAVLLDVGITLNGRTLNGCIVEKKEAEAKYEKAITDGDTTIMLEKLESGLYTMNIGHLQPNESVAISLNYSKLHRWQGKQLRFYLPTTVAPKYGSPQLEAHQIPLVKSNIEHAFSFRLNVTGILTHAHFSSPSHAIIIQAKAEKLLVALSDETSLMNQDMIINIHSEEDNIASAVYDKDGENYVSLISFQPKIEPTSSSLPSANTIIIDCSGSMKGDSIAQAKKGLLKILESLMPHDLFNIIIFGSGHSSLFRNMINVNKLTIERARMFIHHIQADMGGTEIGDALSAAYEMHSDNEIPHNILLITDGEVWDTEPLIQKAQESGNRIFTVGVGSSVSEPFLEDIARVTGGACELISPNEEMAEHMYRHYKRMHSGRSNSVKSQWSIDNFEKIPKQMKSVFDGDTVHMFFRSVSQPTGEVSIQIDLDNGKLWACDIPLIPMPDNQEGDLTVLSRMAANTKLPLLDADAAKELALKYQLMSTWTNFLVIDERPASEQASDLPELRQIPHMLAVGWGGNNRSIGEIPSIGHDLELSMPSWIRKDTSDDIHTHSPDPHPELLPYELLTILENTIQTGNLDELTTSILDSIGVPNKIIQQLLILIRSYDSDAVMIGFIQELSHQVEGLSRHSKRIINKKSKSLRIDSGLSLEIKSSFGNIRDDIWE